MIKKIVCVLLLLPFLVGTLATFPRALGVSAKSCVLIDADTGSKLYCKDENRRLAMASTTKIMTALLCLENKNKDKSFTVKDKDIMVEGSSMGLLSGDRVTLRTLAVGMLMLSGNDAANAAAAFISGDNLRFSKEMNLRAKKIGMKNTNFVTPSGLDSKEHFSTAYDMALLGREAIKNPDFLEICSKRKYTVSFGREPNRRTLYNHNRLLRELDGCIGIKTGFTKKAGRCLVSAAKRRGRTLICVTLSAPDDWQDHKRLYEYGFSLYNRSDAFSMPILKKVKVEGSLFKEMGAFSYGFDEVYLRKDEKAKLVFKLDSLKKAPVYMGDKLGEAYVFVDGVEIYREDLRADKSYLPFNKKPKKEGFFEKLKKWLKSLFNT